MKKIGILYCIIICLCITTVKADLFIEPSSLNLNLSVGEEKIIHFNFTNSFTYPIYNISLYTNDYTAMTPIPSMSPSETAQKQITFKVDEPGMHQVNLTFYFFYNTTVTIEPSTYNINITSNSYIPNTLIVTKGSTIVWTNRDSVIHTATATDFSFDSGDILPGNSWSTPFNDIRDYNIYDKYLFFTMFLSVKNNTREEWTHNPDYDKLVWANLNVTYIEAPLVVELISNNFTVEWNGTAEGVLSITNNGDITAYNVSLECDWVYFAKNNLDVLPLHTTYITYIIAPMITSSEQTNKTHEKVIHITSLNSPSQDHSIFVFVPYAELVGDNMSMYQWWIAKKIFCDAYPTSPYCISEPIIIETNITVYEPPPGTMNFTGLEMTTLLTRLAEMATSEQWQNENLNNITGIINNLLFQQHQMRLEQEEEAKNRESTDTTLLLLLGLIVLAVFFTITFLVVHRSWRKSKIESIEKY